MLPAETGNSDELSSSQSSPDKHSWPATAAAPGKLPQNGGLFTDASKEFST